VETVGAGGMVEGLRDGDGGKGRMISRDPLALTFGRWPRRGGDIRKGPVGRDEEHRNILYNNSKPLLGNFPPSGSEDEGRCLPLGLYILPHIPLSPTPFVRHQPLAVSKNEES